MGSARLDEIAARQSPWLSYAGAVRPTGPVLCLAAAGLIGAATLAQAQTTLPTMEVEAKKAAPAPAKRKTAAKAKAAPVPEPAPEPKKAETGISPVDGYIARVSGTGSKTDTPLLLTPQSMSVVTSDQIEDQGAQGVAQSLRYTPGISVDLNGATSRYDELRIRGFTPVHYLDGMPVPLNQFFATPLISVYGLGRIEALRGPASFLYGQNSPGGLLNMISKRPTEETLNELQLQYGSFDAFQTNFDFSGPATKDGKVLYRLTGTVRDAKTMVDYARDDVFYIAPAFTWRPSADTSLTVLTSYGFDKGTFPQHYLPARGTLQSNPNGRLPRSTFSGEPGWDMFDREQWAVGYAFEHRLNEAWKFRQNLRYSSVDTYWQAHRVEGFTDLDPDTEGLQTDFSTVDRGAYATAADAGIFTVDNQLQTAFVTGALGHKVLVGADYLRMSGNFDQKFAFPPKFGGTVSPIDLYNPEYGAPVPPLTDRRTVNRTEQTQLGIYTQDQIKLDNWLLTLGGRHDWVENSTDDLLGGGTVSRDDTAFTGRAGLTYAFANGLAPYVSYATSFQPTAGVDALGQPFKPTTGNQYEAGIKYQPPGTNLFIAGAIFDIVQQNAVTFDPVTFEGSQTGEVHVRGFDIEAKAKLTSNLDIIASYAYLDHEVSASVIPEEIGTPVPLVARHQASAWAKYSFTEGTLAGLWVGAGVRYTGPTVGAPFLEDPRDVPSHTLVDAGMAYDLGQLDKSLDGAKLSLNVTNLSDEYHVSGYCSGTFCSLGEGRTVMTTLSYRW